MSTDTTFKAIRAATSIDVDSREQIRTRTKELFEEVITKNNLKQEDVISIYFTITDDIHSYNPATALRTEIQWDQIALLCGQEAKITNSLPLCIRALLHVHINKNQKVKHVYLREAAKLRTDWSQTNN